MAERARAELHAPLKPSDDIARIKRACRAAQQCIALQLFVLEPAVFKRSEDRRVVRLKLTPEGSRTVEALIPFVADFLNRVVEDFTREEAEALVRLMTKLIVRLESMDGATA